MRYINLLLLTLLTYLLTYLPPAGGAYSAPPDPLAGFEGPTSKGGGGKRRWDERGGREGREEKGGERRPFW